MAKDTGAASAPDITVTSEPVEPRQVELTVVVAPARIEREMEVVAQAYARRHKVPGYRPGKVPLRVMVAQVGEETLREAAIESLGEKVAREALKSEGLAPYDTVGLERVADDPLTFKVLVPLAPEVTLGDYRALRVPEPEPEPVTEAEIQERLESLRQEVAHLETVDRPAEAGDQVVVSLTGRWGETVVVEDEAMTLDLTPEGASGQGLPPAVVDHLVGLAAGDTARFEVTYSEFWARTELQGQVVGFEAAVESVSGVITPPLDDALAREVSKATTLAELTDSLRESLAARRRLEARERYVDAAVAALVGVAQVAMPPSLGESEVAGMVADLRRQVERQGFTWERWLELQQKDEEALWAEFAPQAEARVRNTLVLSEFARAEDIKVARGEIESEIRRRNEALAGSGLRWRSSDVVRRRMGNELLTGRTVDRLLAIVSGRAAAGAEAEVEAEPEPEAPMAPAG